MTQRHFTFLVALLAAALPLSVAVSNILLGVVLLAFLAQYFSSRPRPPWEWGPMDKPLALLLGTTLISCFLSSSPVKSLDSFRSEYLVLFYLVFSRGLNTASDRSLVIRCFLASSLLSAFFGVFQALGGDVISRVPGLRSHPLTYAEGLMFALALLIPQIRPYGGGVNWRVLSVISLVLSGLLFSQSRGPWLAFLGMVLLWESIRFKRLPWVSGLLLLTLIGAAFGTQNYLSKRFQSIVDLKNDPANLIRLEIWSTTLLMAKDNPIWGHGKGMMAPKYLSAFRQRHPDDHEIFVRYKEYAPHFLREYGETHNLYLQFLVDRGIVGVLTFTVLMVVVFREAWKLRQDISVLGVLLGAAGFLVSGVTESVYNDSEIAMMFYFFLGLLESHRRSCLSESILIKS